MPCKQTVEVTTGQDRKSGKDESGAGEDGGSTSEGFGVAERMTSGPR
jgi:hypothetical protein